MNQIKRSTLALFILLLSFTSAAAEEELPVHIKVSDSVHDVVFELNDTPAALSLYSQLPFETTVENYGDNEKIFYPPEKLDEHDAVETGGRAGGLAYFSPWGNVVMYYGAFGAYPGLYVLGEAIEGAEQIELLSGNIKVGRAEGNFVEKCRIPASLGDLYGELHRPDSVEPVPLIILCHGFGGDHGDHLDYANFFLSNGMAVFNFAFCGGGKGSQSEGSMLDMSVLTEAADLNAVIDHFADDSRFSRIFLMGGSQGGFVASCVAAQRPGDVAALAIEFPAYVLQDDARRRAAPDGTFAETDSIMGITVGRVYSVDAVSFDVYDVIGGYTGDVLILHGDRDGIVPLSYSERAVQVFPNAQLVIMPGQGHGFGGPSRQEAMERELEFFKAHCQ